MKLVIIILMSVLNSHDKGQSYPNYVSYETRHASLIKKQ